MLLQLKETVNTMVDQLSAFADEVTRVAREVGSEGPPEDTPAPPRLMAMWDSTLLAYADRGRVLPAEYRKYVTRVNGDVLPTLLVDGYVAGVWRPRPDAIEATAFHPLPDEVWEALEPEAATLHAFLTARGDATPYGRYDHWWAKPFPETAETRLLSF
ncbi:hypothetical protein SsS58_05995 [Streptomyces scabiei]|uniref:Winged helix DNA-binding domain-containing protein n=1 Tax=Streptomyces scabiei TaxID=1930 RepID=A0A117EFI3_STRSC|nr:hypothetical protein SsS58_05995 [Streptomyces scabiei]